MEDVLYYILFSGIGLSLFYLFYKWIWSREKYFKISRLLLFVMPILAAIVPLIPWRSLMRSSRTVGEVEAIDMLFSVNLSDFVVVAPHEEISYWVWGIAGLYLLGSAFVFLRGLVEYLKLGAFFRKFKDSTCAMDGGMKLTIIDANIAPFSCFNRIVISRRDYENNGTEIIAHETMHIELKHSWDIVFANLIVVLQWFNPAAWLWKREFQLLHEYQVDDRILKSGIDAQKYQLLLIQKSVGEQMFNLGNSFNHGYLKKRIYMMLNNKKDSWTLLKLAFVGPLVVLLIALIGGTDGVFAQAKSLDGVIGDGIEENIFPKLEESDRVTPPQDVKKDKERVVYTVAEVMPEFPGGMAAMMKFLGDSINYPIEAKEKKIQGRVVITFVVREDGVVVDPEIVRGVEDSLDKEALRVVSAMPKWVPGKQDGKAVNVKYTLPITFRIPEEQVVYKEAEFPGGEAEFYKFVSKNIKYPEKARLAGAEGDVVAFIVIDVDGNVSALSVNGENTYLKDELARVVKLMPKWKPAEKEDGTKVESKYPLPVLFKFADSKREARYPKSLVCIGYR